MWEYNYLAHHGIKGMRWGVRRFQNEDGTLTEAGKKRYQQYSDLSETHYRNARNESYWRHQIESENKKMGEAWTNTAKWETKAAQNAMKYAKKADKISGKNSAAELEKRMAKDKVSDLYTEKTFRDFQRQFFRNSSKINTQKQVEDLFDEALKRAQERKDAKKEAENVSEQEASKALSDKEKQSLADLAKSSTYGQDSTKKQIQNHPLIKEAAENASGELKKYDQLEKERQKEEDAFYKNEELYEKYLNKAVDIAMTEDWSKNWGSRKAVYDWYKYDDGDQGENSSIELYIRSAEGKKLAAAQKAADDAYRDFTKTIKSTLKDAMGEYGDQIVNPGAQYPMTVLNRLSWEAQKLAKSGLKVSGIHLTDRR